MNNTQPDSPRVIVARKAVAAAQDASDLEWWTVDHPNEENALERLLADLLAMPSNES